MPEFVNPKRIISEVGLRKDITAADFGCGSGGWTIPLAKMLEKGRVYAVDIQAEPLSALTSKAEMERVDNIKKVMSNVEEGAVEIKGSSCDFVLVSDLLFQVDGKKEVFKEAYRVIKIGGKILVVEWTPEAPFGPKGGKMSSEEVKEMAKETGFRFEKEINAGDYHFALLFVKP